MMIYVYGLRLKGDTEVRYIGQTSQYLDLRLKGHFSAAQCMRQGEALATWLVRNEPQIEIFKIGAVDSKAEGLAMERALIAFCLRLNHRLFNRRLLPVECEQDEAA